MRSRSNPTGADGSATRRRAIRVIAELLGVLLAASVAAAEPVEPVASGASRPRIGLVLSGGGARGAAHVGVLAVLEELRVPVDVISGTSMGSLVGGLYAAGLSPEELGRVIQGVDWVRFFNDKPDRQKLSYRRKEDDLNFLTDFRLAFKDGSFFVPPGLIEGQKLDFLLRTLTLGPDGVARFDDLRLPFRAVATDINTGEAVILETGTLATAQRASMSIPAAFSPVELDGRLLVDGYVANNLPIDAAQGLGAERVIAVDISTPLSDIDSRSSAFAINAHASGFSTKANQDRQKERLAPDDILITPDLGDLGATSFSRMEEAIAAGRRAAEAAAQVLSRYSVSEEEYAAWRAHHRRQPPQLPIVDEIRIENDSLLAEAMIRDRVRVRTGEPLDLKVLQEDLSRLFGLDTFERVQFDLQRESGRMVLVYHVEERLRGKYFLRFGLRLATDFGNDAGYQFGINHVVLPLNAWGGELRSYVQVGESYVVSTEYYQPVDSRDWFFVQPEAAYNLEKFDVFQNDDRLARYDLERVMVAFNLGANIGQFARIQAGIGYLDGQAELDTGDPAVFGDDNFSGGIYQTTLSYDTLDNTSFPNDGAIAQVQGSFMREELGFSESFETLRVDGSIFRTFRRNTVGLTLRYRTNFGAPNSTQFLYSLGGLNRLSGFEHNSIVGPHAGLVRLSAYRRLASPAIFAWEFPLYLGAQFELGNAWQERDEIDDLLYSLGPMLGFDTPLGPLYLAYAYGEGGEHQGYLTLGWAF